MDWVAIGGRIRKQREYLGLTREQFAEKLDITPKFCADIEPRVCPCRHYAVLQLRSVYPLTIFCSENRRKTIS